MYLDAVEQAVSIEKMNNTSFNSNSCDITKEGNLDCEGYEYKIEVEVKGEKPINGTITFEEGKITNIKLEYKNDKVIIKDEKGNLVYIEADGENEKNDTSINTLIVDTSSYFWMRKESGLQVGSTYATPDVFSVTADANSDSIKITGGTGMERLSADNTMWAAVLEYDDGTVVPYIVTGVDTENNVLSIYPETKKSISNGQFTALFGDSQHLTEIGYKALMQYVYSSNPKYADKTEAYDRYAPTSSAEMSSPYSVIPGSPAIYTSSRNDWAHWSMSQSQFGTFVIPYADYSTEGEYGLQREISLDGRSGFYEAFIGTVYYSGVTDTTKLVKDEGYEMHIEWYIDGELVSSELKDTNFVERFCFDIPAGASTAKIKVYYTKMRKNCDDTISIGDSTVWITTGNYGSKLIPSNSSVVQMFDSWGEFWSKESINENGVDYRQGSSGLELSRLLGADNSTLINRSKGGMTSRYGKAWLEKAVLEKNPDYVLLNYGINDYHSATGSSFQNATGPDGSVIDMSTAMTTQEYADNMKYILATAKENGVTPIYVEWFVIAQQPTWMTEFINNLTLTKKSN